MKYFICICYFGGHKEVHWFSTAEEAERFRLKAVFGT